MWRARPLARPPYRVGPFAFPAVRVEPLLLLRQRLGLEREGAALLASHLLPPLAEEDADGSATQTHVSWEPRPLRPERTPTHLLSLPGYICVYSTRNLLANSMKAFIGRLHLVGGGLQPPWALTGWFLAGFGGLERERRLLWTSESRNNVRQQDHLLTS